MADRKKAAREPAAPAARFVAGSDEFGIFCLDTRTGNKLGGRFPDSNPGRRNVSTRVARHNNGPVQPPRTEEEKVAADDGAQFANKG
jgi:hypothetical protein